MTDSTETPTLEASQREQTGKTTRALRKSGTIPAVLYGKGVDTIPVSVDLKAFTALYGQAGSSQLVDLVIGKEKPTKVLIQDVQRDAVRGTIIHADLYKVNMNEKITTDIPIRFEGVSRAVKEMGGTLVKNVDQVKIECLPQHLVSELTVDISSLETFDDLIHIRELELPEGITVKAEGERVVVGVQRPRTEAELKSLEEEPTTEAEPEVAGEEKKEGEEEGDQEADTAGEDEKKETDEEKK